MKITLSVIPFVIFLSAAAAAQEGTPTTHKAKHAIKRTPTWGAKRQGPSNTPTPNRQCAQGTESQCCKVVESSFTNDNINLLKLINIDLGGADVPIGRVCVAISLNIDICADITSCCSNNGFGGLLAIGCTAPTLAD